MAKQLKTTPNPRLSLAIVLTACTFLLATAVTAQASSSYVQVGEIPGFGFPVGGVAAERSSGDLYVVDGSGAVVDRYGPTGTLISSFGSPGSGNGQFGQGFFSGPAGVAVDQSNGDVYVVDRANGRVEKFDSSGAYLTQFNGTATPAGSFSSPSSVAVDPTSGDVYVVDAGNNVIDKFDSSGNLVIAFGSGGALNGSATPASTFAFPITSGEPLPGIAVDSSGRLYVGDVGNGVVDEFNSSGEYQGHLGTGTLSAPSQLAVDSSDDVFAADSSTQSIVKFDAGGNQLVSFPTNTTRTLRGLTVAGDSAHVYASFLPTSFLESSPVLIFAMVTIPDVATGTPSNVQQTTATVEGTVNPDGVPLTDCHFVYTDDGDFKANGYSGPDAKTAPCVPAVSSIPADRSEHRVTADLGGLSPNAAYHVRLLASNTNGSSHGQDRTFRTSGPPSVDETSVSDVTTTEAILKGKVNPENFDATYHFEYGTTTAYGASAPVPDGDLGAGSSDQVASTPISGLSPGTTYNFRVVAQSTQGTTRGPDQAFTTYSTPTASSNCPNERLREENNSTALPDCRAYELVTPNQKDGNGIGLPKDQADAIVAADGRHVEYAPNTTGSFGDATNALGPRFVATRGASGWESTFVGLPAPAHPELTEVGIVVGASSDLSRIFYESPTSLDPLDQDGVTDVYARNLDGSVSWISQNGALATAPISSEFVGTSADGSHVLFATEQALTPAAQSLRAGKELYERVGETTNLVGVRTEGSLTSACGAIAGSGRSDTYGGTVAGSISSDGSRVFFESPDPRGSGDASCSPTAGGSQPGELYVRQDAATTTEISLSHRAGSLGNPAPDGATYRGASTDGSRVLFTSPDLLTDDAALQAGESEALYAYDVGAGALKFIASGVPLIAERGQPMISDDASHVYFLGSVPGKGSGGKNLYLWDEGNISYLSPAPRESLVDQGAPPNARVASDGSALAFTAGQNLTGYDSHGQTEIYLYRASSGSLVCISCDPTNSIPPAVSPFTAPDLGGTAEIDVSRAGLSRAISSDGRMVFFDSALPLVARDTNTGANPSCQAHPAGVQGTGCDVYEYENGTIHLISSGTGRPSHLVGVSSDGADVIINTTNPLVPQDRDGGYGNLFDARIDGGFPFTSPSAACAAESCRTPAPQLPADTLPGSFTFIGPANPSPGSTTLAHVRVVHKTGSRSSLLLTVWIPARGRIAIAGSGLMELARSISKAGTYGIRVALTRRETRLLVRMHKLTLSAKLAFVPSGGGPSSIIVRVTVKA
jgi:DNA-binding beta-propeller fold protein YncE